MSGETTAKYSTPVAANGCGEGSTEVHHIAKRFEQAWQRGEGPIIDDYLPPMVQHRLRMLVELVHTDLELRLRKATAGQSEDVRVEDYCERYPELTEDRQVVLGLIRAEYDLRRKLALPVSLEDFLTRFADYREEVGQFPKESASVPQLPGHEEIRELGRGGMGVVYKARHAQLGRWVAVKMLAARFRRHPDGGEPLARFRLEAQAVAKLQHPNVVHVYEWGECQGQGYFSMELMEGGTLANRVASGPFDPRDAAAIVEKLARGVAHAHERGVIHRDLKPQNVLLAADGTPKIADFGLVKLLEGSGIAAAPDGLLPGASGPAGSPPYMAPEQAGDTSDGVTTLTDVYGLGAILYELLTSRPPLQVVGEVDRRAVLDRVRQENPTPPRQLRPGVPRDLDAICMKCLEREPGRRYPGAAALGEDLQRFLDTRPLKYARRTGPLDRGWKWCRRKPAQALSGSAVLAVLVFSAAVWGQYEIDRIESGKVQARYEEERLRQQTETREAVRRELRQAAFFREDAQKVKPVGHLPTFGVALKHVENAETVLRAHGADEKAAEEVRRCREDVQAAMRNARMMKTLEEIRLRKTSLGDGWTLERLKVGEQYQEGFLSYGIDIVNLPAHEAAARIRGQPLCEELLAGLDEWAWVQRTEAEAAATRQHLLRVVREATAEGSWRRKLSEALTDGNLSQLSVLAKSPDVEALPVSTVCLLAAALHEVGPKHEAIELLRGAHLRHVGDFWINHQLGVYMCYEELLTNMPRSDIFGNGLRFYMPLGQKVDVRSYGPTLGYYPVQRDTTSIQYLLVAAALQPDTPAVLTNLGIGLHDLGEDPRKARVVLERATAPANYAPAHYNLARVLMKLNEPEKAFAELTKAVEIEPGFVEAHRRLAKWSEEKGDLEAALRHWEQVVELRPTDCDAHEELGNVALALGRRDKAIQAYKKATGEMAAFKLGHLYLSMGMHSEAYTLWKDQGWLTLPDDRRDLVGVCARIGTKGCYIGEQCSPGRKVTFGAMTEQERGLWRNLALCWAKQCVAIETAGNRTPPSQQALLQRWLYFPELADLREGPSLDELPLAESDAWASFWAEMKAKQALLEHADQQMFIRLAQTPEGNANRSHRLGLWHIRRSEREDAAKRWGKLIREVSLRDLHFYHQYACLGLLRGDRPEFQNACQSLSLRFDHANDSTAEYLGVRSSALDPQSSVQASHGRLVERWGHTPEDAANPCLLYVAGLFHYRAGRLDQSILHLEKLLEHGPNWNGYGLTRLLLGMCHFVRGEEDKAGRRFEEAAAWVRDATLNGHPSHPSDWLEFQVLYREAEELTGRGARAQSPLVCQLIDPGLLRLRPVFSELQSDAPIPAVTDGQIGTIAPPPVTEGQANSPPPDYSHAPPVTGGQTTPAPPVVPTPQDVSQPLMHKDPVPQRYEQYYSTPPRVTIHQATPAPVVSYPPGVTRPPVSHSTQPQKYEQNTPPRIQNLSPS